MLKAISYWSTENGLANTEPIDRALAAARAAGFPAMELSIGTDGVLHVESSRADCEAIRKTVASSGVEVQTAAAGLTWGCNPTSNDADVRARSIALHAAALERAAWVGAKAMLMVPGVVCSPIAPAEKIRYDVAVQRVREAVKTLLDTAERVGVDLCLENVWNGLFLSPVEFAGFIDEFQSDRLGVYFDVGNVLGYHQHPPHWIELLGKRIKRVHVKDFQENFNWTGGYTFCDLMKGDVPWAETMRALKAIGYDSTITAELLPWDPAVLGRTSAAMDVILGLK